MAPHHDFDVQIHSVRLTISPYFNNESMSHNLSEIFLASEWRGNQPLGQFWEGIKEFAWFFILCFQLRQKIIEWITYVGVLGFYFWQNKSWTPCKISFFDYVIHGLYCYTSKVTLLLINGGLARQHKLFYLLPLKLRSKRRVYAFQSFGQNIDW